VLDLLVPPQDGVVYVYDWKTGRIYDDHSDQRELYALQAFAKYPEAKKVQAEHVYLDSNERRAMLYHRFEIDAIQKRWDLRFKKLEEATEFPYNPQPGCQWCPYSQAKGGPCPF
jgi:hypothetical protein